MIGLDREHFYIAQDEYSKISQNPEKSALRIKRGKLLEN